MCDHHECQLVLELKKRGRRFLVIYHLLCILFISQSTSVTDKHFYQSPYHNILGVRKDFENHLNQCIPNSWGGGETVMQRTFHHVLGKSEKYQLVSLSRDFRRLKHVSTHCSTFNRESNTQHSPNPRDQGDLFSQGPRTPPEAQF